MDRYLIFDPDRFLKDSKNWWKEKKNLEAELEAIPEIPAVENSEVHSTSTSDLTAKTALKKLMLQDEIERIDSYAEACRYAFDHLDPLDSEVLKSFYYSSGYLNYQIDRLANKYNAHPRTIYKYRRRALERFAKLVKEYAHI